MQMGERGLVHAAALGVGTAAVQLAHAAGAMVYATSLTADKLEQVRALGLDETITVSDSLQQFVERVRELTANAGVDVIFDLVGGAYFQANLQALATHGRLTCIGTTAGRKSEIDLSLLYGSGPRLSARCCARDRSKKRRKPRADLSLMSCPSSLAVSSARSSIASIRWEKLAPHTSISNPTAAAERSSSIFPSKRYRRSVGGADAVEPESAPAPGLDPVAPPNPAAGFQCSPRHAELRLRVPPLGNGTLAAF
jgi:NAD(P)-dependent dehydrogenase (short-subunit alcohol dehydrogenase family)